MPNLPNFEGFFNSMSKNKHPFEEDIYKYDEETTR